MNGRVIDYKGVKFKIHKNKLYCLEPIYLDIETSNNHAEDPKDLITWVSSIQIKFHGFYYLLRTPEELIEFYLYLYQELDLSYDPETEIPCKVITLIHNASYDLSYLIPYFMRDLPYYQGEDSQGIIEGVNKFLSYQQGAFEWRCTYRLSNMSLAKWSKELDVKDKKKIGLYDYEKIIYQDQKLTADEQTYDKYDILSLEQCYEANNLYHGDDITTAPLTFTGYVRRELRKACRADRYYRSKYFTKNKLDAELYYAYLKSYAGGMTHNNRMYKSTVIESGKSYQYFDQNIYVPIIGHSDFKSHYPSQMVCYPYFPIGRPGLIYDISDDPNEFTIDEILDYFPDYSTMSVIRFYDAELIDKKISIPFMQFSKCYNGSFNKKRIDNGRVIYLHGEWIMYVDNLTLQILYEQYDLKYEVLKVWAMKNGYLPKPIIDTVNKFFKGKSDKKNIVHDLIDQFGKLYPKTLSANFDLSQTKTALNSIYGCTATNPLRFNYQINNNLEFSIKDNYGTLEEIQEGLDKFYYGRNNFLAYQFGCTVTSLARFELYEFCKAIGYDKILYVDTDSAFYIKDDQTTEAIKKLNEEKRKRAKSVILDNGKEEYYDSFEPEPDCIAFKGLHAKCYGVVTDKGLELTIAGVPARTLIGIENDEPIYYTREEELSEGCNSPIEALDRLTDDFTFKINSGASAIYIGATGNNTPRVPTLVNVNGHIVSTAGGCVIRRLTGKQVHDLDYDLGSYEYTDIPIIDSE